MSFRTISRRVRIVSVIVAIMSATLSPSLGQSSVANANGAVSCFSATLNGAKEVPANASTATGFATIVLNALQTSITVNLSFSGLVAPATAAHIHAPAPAGVNAPVLFPFVPFPAATSGNVSGQVFAMTPTQVAQLQGGLFYVNIHDSIFPGGEIRGQFAPAPCGASTLNLCFNDGRVNNGAIECAQPVAIYCENGGVTLYAVYKGVGYLAFKETKAQLATFPANPSQNTLLQAWKNAIWLYRLTNGNLQVNARTPDNKGYVFIWGGC